MVALVLFTGSFLSNYIKYGALSGVAAHDLL
jgi:hypothetical protein